MYSEFEQDLILACKGWYGDNGIDIVLRDYCGWSDEYPIPKDSIYHFISNLFIKMVNNNHLRLGSFFDSMSPNRIFDFEKQTFTIWEIPMKLCQQMKSEISCVKVKNDNGEWIVKLHEPNPIWSIRGSVE